MEEETVPGVQNDVKTEVFSLSEATLRTASTIAYYSHVLTSLVKLYHMGMAENAHLLPFP